MKLYTEEQVRSIMSVTFWEGVSLGANPMNRNRPLDNILQDLTPIELPSDEEIDDISYTNNPYPIQKQMHIDWSNGFERGAKWVINKIQGGNK